MKKLIITLFIAVTFVIFVGNGNAQNEPVRFKSPKGSMVMDWKKNGGFNGVLMLLKDDPAVVFISYPNKNESLSELRTRAIKQILPMVLSDKKAAPKLEAKPIPNHIGDKGESGIYNGYSTKDELIQILLFEREVRGKTFIYGYFAKMKKGKKPKKGVWADENGNGAKALDEFWKSIK